MVTVYADSYSLNFNPPMPTVKNFTVRQVGGAWEQTIEAIVDSGADRSVIPLKVVEPILSLAKTKSMDIEGFGGQDKRKVTTVQVECYIDGFNVKADIIAFGEEALIGRDILNKLKTSLDGLQVSPRLTMNMGETMGLLQKYIGSTFGLRFPGKSKVSRKLDERHPPPSTIRRVGSPNSQSSQVDSAASKARGKIAIAITWVLAGILFCSFGCVIGFAVAGCELPDVVTNAFWASLGYIGGSFVSFMGTSGNTQEVTPPRK
jgi:predicted aspartyl protease